MTDRKGPVDLALDLLVYAPLGLALSAREEVPRLAERGRARADAQVTVARMMGRFAVTMGRQEAEKAAKEVGDRLADVVGDFLGRPGPAAPTGATGARAPAPTGPVSTAPAAPARAAATDGPRPSDEELAIPGYDSLAASQVVQRLAGLSPEELEAVREYEEATRHRKTILNRVAQLQAGPET